MIVFIDGESCRKGLSRVLLEQEAIDTQRSMQKYSLVPLLEDILGQKNLTVRYYASEIRLPTGYTPSQDVLKHVSYIRDYSRRWVPALLQQGVVYIKAGYLKVKQTKECRNCRSTQDVLQEKGVDVRIAVGLLDHAYSTSDTTIVLFSSDTDLCPAIHKARSHGVRVIYLAFADSVNRAVSAAATETITMPSHKIQAYYTLTHLHFSQCLQR